MVTETQGPFGREPHKVLGAVRPTVIGMTLLTLPAATVPAGPTAVPVPVPGVALAEPGTVPGGGWAPGGVGGGPEGPGDELLFCLQPTKDATMSSAQILGCLLGLIIFILIILLIMLWIMLIIGYCRPTSRV
jgi:hypothetical protein